MRALVFTEEHEALQLMAGLPMLERLLRTLHLCDVTHATVISRRPERIRRGLARDRWARAKVHVDTRILASESPQVADVLAAWPRDRDHERVLVFPSLGVFDSRLIASLAEREAPAALVDSAAPEEQASLHAPAPPGAWGLVCGPALVAREWLIGREGELVPALAAAVEEGALEVVDVHVQPSYLPSLRRKLRPLWFATPASESDRQHGEALIVEAATKRVLDVPAHVYGPFENGLVRVVGPLPVKPQHYGLLTGSLAALATALFALGRYEPAIVVALATGVLTGALGKLARIKLESAPPRLRWLERGSEAAWATAFAFSLERSGLRADAGKLLLMLLAAETVDAIVRRAFLQRYGKAIDDAFPFDRMVRLFAGCRDVYLWILAIGIFAEAPATAFALAAQWAAGTAVAHALRAWYLSEKRMPLRVD